PSYGLNIPYKTDMDNRITAKRPRGTAPVRVILHFYPTMAASIIKALSPETIHKIAAGEVIERPANAVKELVENALDARAGKITVAIEEGGMDLIRVSDNGTGMTHEDARAAWQPHTTSKIRDVEDLSRIASFGFRGEALCSLAAV